MKSHDGSAFSVSLSTPPTAVATQVANTAVNALTALHAWLRVRPTVYRVIISLLWLFVVYTPVYATDIEGGRFVGETTVSADAPNQPVDGTYLELVKSLGGAVQAVAMRGSYVYVNLGASFAVIDIATPNNPTIVGQIALWGTTITDIALSEMYAFVALGRAGVAVIDITNPTTPHEVSRYSEIAINVEQQGAYLYIGRGSEISIWDIRVPTAPQPVKTLLSSSNDYNAPRYTGVITLAENYLYAILSWPNGRAMQIIDVTNANAPQILGTYTASTYAAQVVVAQGYAYVNDPYGALHIVNVKDPTHPTKVTEWSKYTNHIAIRYPYLYATSWSGIAVVNIAQPSQPTLVGAYRVDSDATDAASELFTIAVATDYLMVSNGDGRLRLMDIQQSPIPFKVGELRRDIGAITQIARWDGALYLVEKSQILVFEQADPVQPRLLTTLPLPTFHGQVFIEAGYAVVEVHRYESNSKEIFELHIIDLKNPLRRGIVTVSDYLADLTISGTYAYALTDSLLSIIDFSTLNAPVVFGTVAIPSSATHVRVSGSYAYVATDEDEQLHVIQVADAKHPAMLRSIALDGSLNALAVQGTYLYAAVNDSLEIWDITVPDAPRAVGFFVLPTFAYWMRTFALDGSLALVADISGKLFLLDLAVPTNTVELGRYQGDMTVWDIDFHGQYAYIVTGVGDVAIIRLATERHATTLLASATAFAPSDKIQYAFPRGALVLPAATAGPLPTTVTFRHFQPYAAAMPIPSALVQLLPIAQLAVEDSTGQALALGASYSLTLNYNDLVLTELVTTTLAAYGWDGTVWQPLPTSVSTTAEKLLSVQLARFQPWSLFAESANPRQIYLPVTFRVGTDLRLEQLEVTQAIQRKDNRTPLIAGRPTVLRVYGSTNSPEPVNQVFLAVTGTRKGIALANSPLLVGPWAVFPQPNRGEYRTSFNVQLPLDWVAGDVALSLSFQSTDKVQDINLANNHLSTNLTFQSVPPLALRIIPIRYTHKPSGRVYPAIREDAIGQDISDYLMRTYPIAQLNLSTRAAVDYTGDIAADMGLGKVIEFLAALKKADGAPDAQVYYGLLPEVDFAPEASGRGYIGIRVSTGFNSGGLVAHELGHNLGRSHAPCGVPDPDLQYPYAGASIGEYGFDLLARQIFDPALTKDFMSYCGPHWISDYTYTALFNDQRKKGALRTAPVAQGLLVRATVSTTQRALLHSVYAFPSVMTDLPLESAYSLTLLDAAQHAVATYPVSLAASSENGQAVYAIGVVVPQPAQPVHRIQLRYQEQVIAERTLMTESVQAAATYQLEQSATALTLRWQPTDQPALVRYTNDNGQSWLTLAIDAANGELPIDPATLPGGTGRFEILPADLSQPSLMAASTAPTITLPNQPPKAWIVGPTTVHPNTPLILFGHGDDPEDGALETWQWTVNGAPVAAGQILQLPDVGLLDPVVTLTVTDRAGQQTTATYHVAIHP